ncbi:MAG: DNA topoisomerase subunit B [Candidatus Micrarchaeia archaeon]
MENQNDEYNASKIVVLEGTQGIRKRPAMYIGSTGVQGVVHLLIEIIDNAIDESLAGYCKNISVSLLQEDSGDIAEVSDDGRGIPVDIMPKYNKPALEVIMTSLHSGAKFDNNTYKISGGLHGVGLTVVNALSEYMEVTVKKGGNIYRQKFSRGQPVSQMEIIGNTDQHGTTIRFKPDPEIFPDPRFDSEQIKAKLEYASFLNPGIRIKFSDERFPQKETKEYYSEQGIPELIMQLNKDKQPLTNVIYAKKQQDSMQIEFALQYNNGYDEKVLSFVNDVRTTEGGTHEVGFRSALSRAIINYASESKNGKDSDEIKLTGDDVREGLTAVISLLMQSPEFEGQTKEKLGNTKVKSAVESAVYAIISRYLEEHPSDAKAIVGKVQSAAIARESARKAKELARKKSIFETAVLPGKLADCVESDPEKSEIFIVEGESAGGSSKQGRDKNFQAILPLRGKILNVEKATDEKIFSNAEIHTMVAAFGTGIKETFNPEAVRYKKIIIMTDADVDGSHIKTLLLTFFYRYMKKLVELGYVYIAQPPLYKISKGKEQRYCYTDDELAAAMKELGSDAAVQRYKGLGEMNPEQLWQTTMDPERRILKQVTIKDAEKADRLLTILMGIDVSERRKFIEEHSKEVRFLDL